MKKKCVITIMLLIACNAYTTNAEVNLRDKEKVNNEYMLSLKNKLSMCKAFKAPFAKLSGIKPMLFFGLIGFMGVYFTLRELKFYDRIYNEFVTKEALSKGLEERLRYKKAMFETLSRGEFYLFWNKFYCFVTGIPCVALMVNKWLDWSCESLQEDIDAVMQDIVV
ncbi:MAG: hypothetical protein WD055_05815 [Candidatus Dependentiae bacterium]